jgi:hypothetical protein
MGLAKVDLTEFVHELRLHLRALAGEQFGAYPQPRCDGAVPDSPGAEPGQHWDELDRRLGEAVGGPLPRPGVLAGEQSGADEPLEAVGQDVRCDPLLRASEQKRRRLPNITSRSTSRLLT